jgi:hypothetical protein
MAKFKRNISVNLNIDTSFMQSKNIKLTMRPYESPTNFAVRVRDKIIKELEIVRQLQLVPGHSSAGK